jgi:protein-L-isoaspartate(D-aspartate) O-methyltransferase
MLSRTLKVALLGLAGLVTISGVACAMGESNGAKESPQTVDPFEALRLRMVATQIEARGVSDRCVLDAMRRVPRHAFVPPDVRDQAYTDRPLPIGLHQTISQPYIVALMTELVRPQPDTKVLEIGTGSGYQAAVLAECAGEVYTIEILPELGRQAGELLARLGHESVHTRIGDGFDGWEEHAPFDAIIVTAAPPRIPQPLLDQLAPGGRLVIPVGEGFQNLVLVTRTESGFDRRTVTPVRFVPMTGKAQQER